MKWEDETYRICFVYTRVLSSHAALSDGAEHNNSCDEASRKGCGVGKEHWVDGRSHRRACFGVPGIKLLLIAESLLLLRRPCASSVVGYKNSFIFSFIMIVLKTSGKRNEHLGMSKKTVELLFYSNRAVVNKQDDNLRTQKQPLKIVFVDLATLFFLCLL